MEFLKNVGFQFKCLYKNTLPECFLRLLPGSSASNRQSISKIAITLNGVNIKDNFV